MLILGIDTSGKTASAALLSTDTDVLLAQTAVYTQKTHSQVIMPLVRSVLEQSEKQLSEVDTVAVAAGPGSYTGLRIGVAAVKALAFGLDCGCCGVSTLEGLSYNNIAFQGLICPIIKARGELVYAAVYRSDGYALESVLSEGLVSRDELALELAMKGERVLLCGDGSEDFFTDYRSGSFYIAPPQGRLQSAAGICLAAASKPTVSPDELEVSYLQQVKAEKDLEKKLKGAEQ